MAKAEVTVKLADYEEVKAALVDAERWRKALEFYADPKHWESVMVDDHGNGYQTWESGAAVDGGARARAALIDGPESLEKER